MKLVVLHGPPAVGKYSIAKALESIAGTRTFHNHLAIDVAKTIHAFDVPGFWEMVEAVRMAALQSAAQHFRGTIVYTWVYAHPDDLPFYEKLEQIVHQAGGEVLPVYLHASVDVLAERVVAPERKRMDKVSTVSGLKTSLGRWNCVAIPRDNCLSVDTSKRSAEDSARELVRRLGLG